MVEKLSSQSQLVGVTRLPEHRTEHLQLVLNEIFIGYGQIGEPVAQVLKGVSVTPSGARTKYDITILHAGYKDEDTSWTVGFVFDNDQIKLLKNKSKKVLDMYKSELCEWQKDH